MNEDAVQALIDKNPKLKRSKEQLMAMQPGKFCIHRSWGFGQIQGYQAEENRLIIDFDDKEAHSMDPAFCVNTMDVLSDEHILARFRTEPDVVNEMISKQPVDLVVEILKSIGEKGTVQEIDRVLKMMIGEAKAKKWWTNTRKLVAKDSRIGSPVKKTDPYFLRDEPVKREDEVFDAYFKTNSAERKTKLLEELVAAAKENDEIKGHLEEIIGDFSTLLQETHQFSLLERLLAVWIRDDALKLIGKEEELIEPTADELVAQTPNLDELGNDLPAAYQPYLLKLVVQTHPDDWSRVVLDLLKNSSGKFTTECVNFLYNKKEADLLKETLDRWLIEQNLKGPVIIWIIKNRNSRKFSKIIHDLINPRLFTAMLYAIDYEALQSSGTRRVPLADLLSDDQELIGDLLAEADPETAKDLANSLLMNQGFEELTKKSILARLIKLFPNVQSLVDSGSAKEEDENRLFVSRASYDARQAEYEDLVKNKIPENKKAIAVAREHGDLKENSEYKMARQDQTTLMARKGQLESDLGKARITDFTEAPTEVVGVGSSVELTEGDASETTLYHVLGAWDSDPDKQIISYQTPLAKKLIGQEAGSTVEVTVGGSTKSWTIKTIQRYVDLKK